MKTKVVTPLEWAYPPVPVERELIERAPARSDGRPPILFVHGAFHGAWCWDEHFMPALVERGWHCFAVSLRGHGGSGGRDGIGKWMLRDYEHDVLQALIRLPEPPVIVGHSMGGVVVQRVLERYRARAGILLASLGHRHGAGTAWEVLRHHPGDFAAVMAGRSLRSRPGYFFGPTTPADDAGRLSGRTTPESPLAQYQLMLPRRPRPSRSPMLVVGAAEDKLVPARTTEALARHYRVVPRFVPGAGHDMMLDVTWPRTLEVLVQWLDATVRVR